MKKSSFVRAENACFMTAYTLLILMASFLIAFSAFDRMKTRTEKNYRIFVSDPVAGCESDFSKGPEQESKCDSRLLN